MTDLRRTSTVVSGKDVAIETYIDGQGPCLVILPSYGRDGGEDYDNITGQLAANGWQVIRPQPRGIAGSTGPMDGQSLHDLAGDVALCIRAFCQPPVVLLGHAFGNVLARVVTTDHPDLVKVVVLAATEAPCRAGGTQEVDAPRSATSRRLCFLLERQHTKPDHIYISARNSRSLLSRCSEFIFQEIRAAQAPNTRASNANRSLGKHRSSSI